MKYLKEEIMFKREKGLALENGIYHCDYLNNKTVMILVPHEDDELIIAGSIFPILRANHCNISVVYSTNGDYTSVDLGKRRLEEALDYCKHEGISVENVFFMGFGDQGTRGEHLYNSNVPIKSPAGREQTYGLESHKSVAELYFGNEVEYSSENYKRILKSILINILPDIIICIDCDIHSDHIALSLMFEDVLSELIRKQNFTPIVLKAFAHDMLWMGVKDRSSINLKACLPIEKNPYHTYAVQFQKSYYAWEDRIRFPVFSRYATSWGYGNLFRKTMLCYRSQYVKFHFNRLLNSDQLFWERKTDNLIYRSKINVSSGNSECFYTMKMFECENLMLTKDILEKSTLFWKPNAKDVWKMATFDFENVVKIGVINIYTGFDQNSIKEIKIIIDDKLEIQLNRLKNYGNRNEIKFDKPILCKRIVLQLFDDVTRIIKFEVLPYEEEELYYAKVMADNNFIYKYYLGYFEKRPELQIYEYGNKGSRVIEKGRISELYRIYRIKRGKKFLVKKMEDVFTQKNRMDRIFIENKKNSAIFDEVEVCYCMGCFKWLVLIGDRLESVFNDVIYKMLRVLHSYLKKF